VFPAGTVTEPFVVVVLTVSLTRVIVHVRPPKKCRTALKPFTVEIFATVTYGVGAGIGVDFGVDVGVDVGWGVEPEVGVGRDDGVEPGIDSLAPLGVVPGVALATGVGEASATSPETTRRPISLWQELLQHSRTW